MKQIRLALAVAVSVLLSQCANAVIFRSSQIVGYATGDLGQDAGTGTLDGWVRFGGNGLITLTNGSGSLIGTNLGLVASAGDKVFVGTTNRPDTTRNQFVPSGTFPMASVDTNLYFSFLYRFGNAADVSADGELIVRMNTGNSGATAPQHWDLVAKNVAGQIQIGIAKALGVTNYATTNISAGETFFVVVRQHLIVGAQNDVYDLWINPPKEFFGTNDADVPPVSATVGALTTDGTETVGSGPGRFVFPSGVNAQFDEYRAASTWAEVTPWFGQCVSAGVAVSPASVTNSAEVSATFRVFELGTSATFQWQVSTNNGSTFSNIAGADSSTYTTPNLALGDNGNKYRAIISVGCNGSSATSGVATVTLTTPVETPVGLVMDDTFDRDDRSVGPVTSSTSVWFTSGDLTDNLTTLGQGGNMLATPSPTGSSLWLGYFRETNQPPVHLAVGSTLKVTLPFIPNSFGSFTNNAGLRFGLFDYSDGGTRITADGPNVGGSLGNGFGVRGYMLNLNFGTNFNDDTPLDIFARNFLLDNNLMGTTGNYESLSTGPIGGVDTNAPSFHAGTQYTLEFSVTRADIDSVVVTTTVSGGGSNWTHSALDNNFAYHRFDSFGIRPNSLQTSADSFTFPEFVVEVVQGGTITLPRFNITEIRALSPDSVKLTWDSAKGAPYYILSRDSLFSSVETTNAIIVATGPSTSYTNSPISDAQRYFRVMTLPFTP